MKIRSITAGVNWNSITSTRSGPQLIARFLSAAREAYQRDGLEVQTIRLATEPISERVPAEQGQSLIESAHRLDEICLEAGIDYASMGPVLAAQVGAPVALIDAIPQAIQSTERVFASVQVASRQDGINLRAIEHAAAVIKRIAQITDGGFGNLRFAALANCPPHSPFFPAAYHAGEEAAFSVALESADLAVGVFSKAKTLEEAKKELQCLLEEVGSRIGSIAESLAKRFGYRFMGIDLSMAPFPADDRSIAWAIERLGVPIYGGSGTLFASALLAGVLRQVEVKKCGFSGLMYPLLEDSTMARRSREGGYTLDSLLLYSAVCGTGLDTIPLPGDITVDQLAGILLDVAALATVLDKPLTARLLPVPGKRAGDATEFDFDYFANAHILEVPGKGIKALLNKGDHITLPYLHQG